MRRGCILALVLVACADQVAPSPAVRLSLSRGGGFTGLVEGCTVDSDGGVLGWQRLPGAPPDTLWRASLPAEGVRASLRGSRAEGRAWAHREAGNLTSTLVYAAADTTWTRSWAGSSLPPDTPMVVVERVAWLEAVCEEAQAATRPVRGADE